VVEVRVPPLRERREDIALLAHYFLDKYRVEFSKDVRRLHPATVSMLQSMDWAGSNVRELEHAIQRAMVLCETTDLTPDLFEDGPTNLVSLATTTPQSDAGAVATPASFDNGLTYQDAKEETVRQFTVQYLQQRLREGEGNITRAAELSGMLRPNFKKLMKKYGVEVDDALEIRVQG
jgi:DNA-binding NtrC family response regulator